MRQVIIICPDIINKKMAGPAIRYWNFAIELSKYLNVTLYIPNGKSDMDFSSVNFAIIKGDVSQLKKRCCKTDSIIIQGIALRKYAFLKKIRKPIIVDLYDPITLENLELRKNLFVKQREEYHESDLHLVLEQLAIGDFFICASEKQKDYWLGMLSAINRVNPYTYLDNKNMDKLIGVVPFGLENEEPKKSNQVLKGVWPGIAKDDKVLIWGGGIWNWFDPITLVKAMEVVAKKRKDVKLFFMGIGHPNSKHDLTIANECIQLSKELGLYDNNIFFNNWVEYNERQNYLLEADIGITTYFNNLETRYSFRTRVLDYIWCELPMILTQGDFMAELIVKEELGLSNVEKNYEELAETILNLLGNKEQCEKYKKNIAKMKEKFKWESVVKPLIEFCSNPYVSSDKNKVKVFYSVSIITKFKYYYIRVVNKLIRIIRSIKCEKKKNG